MRRTLALSLTSLLLLTATHVQANASSTIGLRAEAERLGAQVGWEPSNQSISLSLHGSTVKLYPSTGKLSVDGRWSEIGALPVEAGRTQVTAAQWAQINARLQAAAKPITGFKRVAQLEMPGKAAAEIVTATPDGQYLLVTNASAGSVSMISVSDLADLKVVDTFQLKSLNEQAEVTSVAVTPDGRFALAAVRTGDTVDLAWPGFVAVIDLEQREVLGTLPVGVGPDAITISADGRYAVVAIEDEEIGPDGEIDMKTTKRPGSVTVIELNHGNPLLSKVTNVAIDLTGVEGAVYPHDPQPEYVAISPDNTRAAVTLQENNAIAIIDLASKQVEKVFSLGVLEVMADVKQDGAVSLTTPMKGRPEPDALVWSPDGRYLITANEGDLGKNEFGDGVRSGTRNFAIWSLDGKLAFQTSMDAVAHSAGLYPDSRSENRGTEPEHVQITSFGAQKVLTVALERANALAFYDVTKIEQPVLLSVQETGTSPESSVRIPGTSLIASADEVSGTVTLFQAVR